MHEWFATAVAADRAQRAEARATIHRLHVADGTDLRSLLVRPLLARAELLTSRLATRRADADTAVSRAGAFFVRAA